MTKRWTIKELEEIDDADFLLVILNERKSNLNCYSPLYLHIKELQNRMIELQHEINDILTED